MPHKEDDHQQQQQQLQSTWRVNSRAGGGFCDEEVVVAAVSSAAVAGSGSTADTIQGPTTSTLHNTTTASTSTISSSCKRKVDTLSDDGNNIIIDDLKKQRYGEEEEALEETNESVAEGEEEVEHEVDLDALLDGSSDPDVLVVHGYDKASVLATAAAAAAAAAALASSTGGSTSNTALTTTDPSVLDGTTTVTLGLPTPHGKTEGTDTASGIPRQHMWDTRLKELMDFRALTGHCLVPKLYPPNPPLGRWVGRQRSQYKLLQEGLKSRLTEERISKLQLLGFVWYAGPPNGSGPGGPSKKKVDKNQMEEHPQGPNIPVPVVKNDLSTQGATMLVKNRPVSPVTTKSEIVNVKEELDIPLPLLPPLDLTILQTANTLQPPPQVSAVAVSSSSPGRNDQWELRFQDLLNYKAKHGTCRVPRTVPVLGRWVKKQREHNRRRAGGKCTHITLQRLERLDAIGFVWECSQPDDWQTRYLQLKQYKEIHGNCLVPKKHSTLGRVSKIIFGWK
jgi:hypothetical protein